LTLIQGLGGLLILGSTFITLLIKTEPAIKPAVTES
jgi:hypothetical protein